MPPALRAIASSCGTSPEGIHIKHLLNIGHNLTQGSRDLSTAALGRAFQIARRKARAACRVKEQALTTARAQAMLSRYSSNTLLVQRCQVCGTTSTWAHNGGKSVQGEDKARVQSEPTVPGLHKASASSHASQDEPKPCQKPVRGTLSTTVTISQPTEVTVAVQTSMSIQPQEPGEVIEFAQMSSKKLETQECKNDQAVLQRNSAINAAIGHQGSSNGCGTEQSSVPDYKPANSIAECSQAGLAHAALAPGLRKNQQPGQDMAVLTEHAVRRKKKRPKQQHAGVGVRLGGTHAASHNTAKASPDVIIRAPGETPIHKSNMRKERKASAYMDKLRAQLQGVSKVTRTVTSEGTHKKAKKKTKTQTPQ